MTPELDRVSDALVGEAKEQTEQTAEELERELVITRVIDAPRELVFKVWTDPAAPWRGPRDFTTTSMTMDVRSGGLWRSCFRSLEGKEFWAHGVYRAVVEPERLVFTWAYDNGSNGHETLVTVTFLQQDGGTEISFHQALFESRAERDSQQPGMERSHGPPRRARRRRTDVSCSINGCG